MNDAPKPRTTFRIPLVMVCLITSLLLSGCAAVIPLPAFPQQVQKGRQITSDSVAFIQPGLTRREQVVTTLGTNYVELLSQPCLAYSWEITGGGGVWWVATPYGGLADSWQGGWRAWFVAFDERGIVRAIEFQRVSPKHSLHHHMREWMRELNDPQEEVLFVGAPN